MHKYENYSRLNHQHNWWDMYYHLMSMRLNLHFDSEIDIHMCSKLYKENDYNVDLEWLTTDCTHRVFHILREVG